MKELWFCFLVWSAWKDWKKREIPVWIFGLAAICGVAGGIWQADSVWWWLWEMLKSMMIGAVLLAVAWVTEGAVGSGDGCWLLVSGCYLVWQENLWVFCTGLALSGLCSVCIMMWGIWKGASVWKIRMPFLPFLLPGGLWLLLAGRV